MVDSVQGAGLRVERRFCSGGNVYDQFIWGRHDVDIKGDGGVVFFTQKDAEFPDSFSKTARTVVASKYLYGEQGSPQRESSAKQLVGRVTETVADWSQSQRYLSQAGPEIFRDELAFLVLDQRMAFNSPVWFNVGVHRYASGIRKQRRDSYIIDESGNAVQIPEGKEYEYPQTSACFIQSVDDTMEDIMDLSKREAMLFKYGSGTGTDVSTLRSSREKLAGGGKPSGPLKYMMFYDRVAGIVKSGGKTRRAAKMQSLRTDHPDIMDFIEAKMREQKKLETLMDNGYSHDEAEETVAFQNANFSVRADDEFMKAVEADGWWQTVPVHNKEMLSQMPRYRAREIFRRIAEGTHYCGDPGIQFHTTINRWHTCPNSAPINASNPCSEYMFVNDSACNLASHNLLKYKKEDGGFDIDGFGHAVRLTAIAQESLISKSSYPTKNIAQNAHDFRPLGMGYANLGALLMELGLPYDSDEARATAAAITAFMTARVYSTSAEMAKELGPFKKFEENREPMLNVMRMHRSALSGIDRTKLPKKLENILDAAIKEWDNAVEQGERYGFRNAQATVLAPTGTIGFMMDCATTGIESETGLVKIKRLAGGGRLNLVNSSIENALKNLGYDEAQVRDIKAYIAGNEDISKAPHLKPEHAEKVLHADNRDEVLAELGYDQKKMKDILSFLEGFGTIEGSPHLREEHLPVFDCAYRCGSGKRTIHYTGHLGMMAAVQPFLSGAISKTVGLPSDISVEEIDKVYMDAWKMGLKAVALYRDGSKRNQPLEFKADSLEDKSGNGNIRDIPFPLPAPKRWRLAGTRPSITHKFEIGGEEGYLQVGFYPTGWVGEFFVSLGKEGSTTAGFANAWAIAVSMGLQHGIPLRKFIDKFGAMNFPPHGMVAIHAEKSPLDEIIGDVMAAKSPTDYVMKVLGRIFYDSSGEPIQRTELLPAIYSQNIKALPAPEKKEKNDSLDIAGKTRQELLKLATTVCPDCGGKAIPKDAKGCKFFCIEDMHDIVSGCGG